MFGAKAIAGIGEVPGTIEDRSIVLELKRKSGTENTQRFRRKEAWASSVSLRDRLGAWAANAEYMRIFAITLLRWRQKRLDKNKTRTLWSWFSFEIWQEREDSNPRPLVLEFRVACLSLSQTIPASPVL